MKTTNNKSIILNQNRIETMKTNKQYTFGNKAARFVGLFLVLGVLLGVSSTEVFAQVPPANTNIGNQASATYVDNGGNTQSITSNTVITVVQQVAGVDITDGISLTVSPGGQVTYSHTITNLGNGVDSFTLSVVEGSGDFDYEGAIQIFPDADQDGVPDNFTPITQTPNIDPDGTSNPNTYSVLIVASIPTTAQQGETETIVITATSDYATSQGQTVNDSGTNITEVDEGAVINVQKDRDNQFVQVGDTVTYIFAYDETGGTTDGANLVIRDPLPAGVTYVPGSGVWSGAAGVNLTDGDDVEPVATGITYKYVDSAVDSIIAVIANVNAGSSGNFSFKVVVNANTYGQTIINQGNFSHDGDLTPNNTNEAAIQVSEDFGIQAVGADTVRINSAEQGSIINFLNVYVNTGTGTDSYTITASNENFPAGRSINFYQVDSNNQPTSTYQDLNGDGNPDVVNVASGDTIKVITQVILPSGTSGGPYSLVKTLTSFGDPDSSAFHTDVLDEITTPTVDITNVAEIGNGSETGTGQGPEPSPVTTVVANPGNTVEFTLFINNTSGIDDTYQLDFGIDTTAAGDLLAADALPSGWTASFRDAGGTNSITSVAVTSGNFVEVRLRVNIPAGFQPGTNSIYVRASSQNTGARDLKHEAVTVNTVRLMTLIDGQNAQVSPGGSVDYIHTLTINSNVDENDGVNSDLYLQLSNSVPVGWTARVYWDTDEDGVVDATDSLLTSAAASGPIDLPASVGTLQFGDQLYFIVQVTASAGLNDEATVTTTIEVTDFLEELADVSNDDLTEVQAGRLSIDKFQAPDSVGQAGTFTKAQFQVLPGDTVYYKVVIVNDGSEPVTSIVIQDVVPSFTKILDAATFTIDSGTIGSVVLDSNNPTTGNTGTIRLDIDQLDPTEQVSLFFSVTVDDSTN